MMCQCAFVLFLCIIIHVSLAYRVPGMCRVISTSLASEKRLSSNRPIKFENGVPQVRLERRRREPAVSPDGADVPEIQSRDGLMKQGKPFSRPDMVNVNRLKVLGGSAKGMKIDSPDVYLRPMMAKVREALFSSLAAMELFDGGEVRVLDVFSGSGSIGLEALSRGATHATFVDMSAECISTAMRNARTCSFSQQASSACASALDVLRAPHKHNLQGTYDLITLTPPYEEVVYAELIDAVCTTSLIKENTIVVIEYPEEMGKLPYILGDNKLFGVRNRKYGRTVLAIYVYRPGRKFDLRPYEFV